VFEKWLANTLESLYRVGGEGAIGAAEQILALSGSDPAGVNAVS